MWIDGRIKAGNLDVTSDLIPSNGIYLSLANQLSLTSNGTERLRITNTGLLQSFGSLYFSGSQPSISLFNNSLDGTDYFIQQTGSEFVLHSADTTALQIAAQDAYVLNATSDRGHEWYNMDTISNTLLMKLFPSGRLQVGSPTPMDTVPCAALNVTSTTSGVLLPRMTSAEKNSIVAPLPGLIVYDTDLGKLCMYTGTWEVIDEYVFIDHMVIPNSYTPACRYSRSNIMGCRLLLCLHCS